MNAGNRLFYLPYSLARLRAAQGRSADALQMLEEAVERGFRWQGFLKSDLSFAELRASERFRKILDDLAVRNEGMRVKVATYGR
jgi:hypothetical protein